MPAGPACDDNGTDFKSGFLAGAAGKLANLGLAQSGIYGSLGIEMSNGSLGAIASRTAVAAIVGGTVSQLSGGQFASGARTAAMQHLFNAERSRIFGGRPKHPLYDGPDTPEEIRNKLKFGSGLLICVSTGGAGCLVLGGSTFYNAITGQSVYEMAALAGADLFQESTISDREYALSVGQDIDNIIGLTTGLLSFGVASGNLAIQLGNPSIVPRFFNVPGSLGAATAEIGAAAIDLPGLQDTYNVSH